MKQHEAIKFLENIEVGTFLTVNIPISAKCKTQVTAMYKGRDKNGRFEFVDTGEFILSKEILNKGLITIEKEYNSQNAQKIYSKLNYKLKQNNKNIKAYVLKFDNKNLFNSKLLQQYDEEGQKGYLGYLIQNRYWKIENNKLIFPDIDSNKKIKEVIEEYTTNSIKNNINAKEQALSDALMYGIDEVMQNLKNRQKELEQGKNNKKTKADKII